MRISNFRVLPLLLALAFIQSRSFACEHCWAPETIACAHDELYGQFQTGGGDDPAAYQDVGVGWTNTASGFSAFGREVVLTWSIVPDGTAMPRALGEPNNPSRLRAFFDGIFHGGPGPGGNNLTLRAWFPIVKSAFDRWDAVSAIRFSYEPNDNGTLLGAGAGILGVRGDHRLGGHTIDGIVPIPPATGTVVAYNYFPHNSDMVIDTDEVGRLGNPEGNYLRLRNTLMHEIGHGLGLDHPASSDSNFLMEGLLDVTIDGPQFDDILGVHRLYGDRYEEFGGNDTHSKATFLGSLSPMSSIRIGEDATDRVVAPTDVDFVSINMLDDVDYFRVSLTNIGRLSIVLTPLGPTYQEGPHGGTQTTFVASAQNDLSLELFDSTGVGLLASSALGGLGVAEEILNFSVALAGDYFIKVMGSMDAAQFYQLDISYVPEPTSLTALLLGVTGWGATRRRF